MTNLKTLKDIKEDLKQAYQVILKDPIDRETNKQIRDKLVITETVRQEAIKWLKELEKISDVGIICLDCNNIEEIEIRPPGIHKTCSNCGSENFIRHDDHDNNIDNGATFILKHFLNITEEEVDD